MKKALFAITGFVLLVSCIAETNEEKARDLIEPEVKAKLIIPESYEFAKIQLDSCFSDDSRGPEAIIFAQKAAKLYKKYKQYNSDVEYAGSKAEIEKAKRKAADVKYDIIQLYKENKPLLLNLNNGLDKHEFTGWMATFDYRAETAGGTKAMGETLFFLNKDLTKITHCFDEEDLYDIQSADLDDIKYEFEKELEEVFESEGNQ